MSRQLIPTRKAISGKIFRRLFTFDAVFIHQSYMNVADWNDDGINCVQERDMHACLLIILLHVHKRDTKE